MFVGPSGKKLDGLLSEAGIRREAIFMTNLLKCVLPNYRGPSQVEIEACSSYLDREIELVDPSIISTLGYFSTKYIFERYGIENNLKFPEVCGRMFLVENRKLFPLGHPAAILYDDSIEYRMTNNYKKLGKLWIQTKDRF